jgi:mannose-6-phosphate isomerase-like protein (cupin superfamily)
MEEEARCENPRMSDPTFRLTDFPVHLGLGATAERQERFTGTPDWYERYGERHASDGNDGRLVSMYTFTEPWSTWEMHPNGDELVCCVSGEMTLHQEIDGSVRTVTLRAGDAIVNPPGAWHTADIDAPATAFFITAGRGTQVRPR